MLPLSASFASRSFREHWRRLRDSTINCQISTPHKRDVGHSQQRRQSGQLCFLVGELGIGWYGGGGTFLIGIGFPFWDVNSQPNNARHPIDHAVVSHCSDLGFCSMAAYNPGFLG
jgi:hypothetical protein